MVKNLWLRFRISNKIGYTIDSDRAFSERTGSSAAFSKASNKFTLGDTGVSWAKIGSILFFTPNFISISSNEKSPYAMLLNFM
jgi:hypothetical protein